MGQVGFSRFGGTENGLQEMVPLFLHRGLRRINLTAPTIPVDGCSSIVRVVVMTFLLMMMSTSEVNDRRPSFYPRVCTIIISSCGDGSWGRNINVATVTARINGSRQRPEEAVLICAFRRYFALRTTAARGMLAVALEFSTPALAAGNSPSAALSHAMLWRGIQRSNVGHDGLRVLRRNGR